MKDLDIIELNESYHLQNTSVKMNICNHFEIFCKKYGWENTPISFLDYLLANECIDEKGLLKLHETITNNHNSEKSS